MNKLKNIGKKIANGALKFWKDESGMGTVEVESKCSHEKEYRSDIFLKDRILLEGKKLCVNNQYMQKKHILDKGKII